jgi:hypothetical protein
MTLFVRYRATAPGRARRKQTAKPEEIQLTKYIVLHRTLAVAMSPATAADPGADRGWFPLVGTYDAVRGEDACVQAAQKNDIGGEFRAVPARSWNDPVIIELDTTPRAVVKKPASVMAATA